MHRKKNISLIYAQNEKCFLNLLNAQKEKIISLIYAQKEIISLIYAKK